MDTSVIIGVLVAVNIGVLLLTRMRKKVAVTDQGVSVDAAQRAITRGREEKFALFARFLKGNKKTSVIERNLVTAGLMLKPTEFLMANLVSLAVIILLGIWHISNMPNDGAFFTLLKRVLWLAFYIWLGWRLPQMILQFLADKRRTTLEYQLADALTIISSGLKGGYSFVQGLDMASQQLESPIKEETARVLRLIQLGLDTPRALEQLAERVNSYDYDMTVSATNIQLAVGGNLSALLEGIAETIRARISLRRDIAALTAQGRISGGILIALPIGIALMLRVINPEYMGRLFEDYRGQNLLYLAAFQQFLGIYWIKKLLDFDN